jgi:hypothetical protein
MLPLTLNNENALPSCVYLPPGAHVLSGNVLELTSMYELFPGLKDYLQQRDGKPRFSFFGSSSSSPQPSPAAGASEQVDASSPTADSSSSSSSSSSAAAATEPAKPPLSPLAEAAAARGLILNDQGLPELPPEDFTELPIRQRVTKDLFYFLTSTGSIRLPVPPGTKNKKDNYVISLR